MCPFIRSLIATLVLAGNAATAADNASPSAVASEAADASITIDGGIVALGIGYEWGHGTLIYRGRGYPFQVRGVSVVDFGAAKITGTGEVFNLKSLADFEGRYAGSTFGSALSSGASMALFTNEHGVRIRARSAISGIRLNFSGNGLRIRFADPSRHSEDRQ